MSRFTSRAVVVVGCLLTAAGCGSPALIQVETVVREDGSCDRLIWQPKGQMLPDGALTPGWNARWRGVSDVAFPPAFSQGRGQRDHAYFHAHGAFSSPADIPEHFVRREAAYPEVGASELRRSYERKDLGLVIEHRWVETVTNIVTRDGFLMARDEFLELGIPILCEGMEQVYGDRYDVSKAVADVRTRGRKFLDDASLAYYEMIEKHETEHDAGVRFAGVFQRLGVQMFDEKGHAFPMEEAGRRIMEFARGVIREDFRRRDGKPLTDEEVQAILESQTTSPFGDKWSAFLKSNHETIKTRLGPLLLRMTGLYNFPPIFQAPTPQFAFSVRLPGRIVEAESNGSIADSGQVRWNFDGGRIFPDGFTMKAVSIDFREEAQRKLLGKVVIADPDSARKYSQLIGDEGPLLDLVRRAGREGDAQILRDARGDDDLERARIAMLKQFLQLTPEQPTNP